MNQEVNNNLANTEIKSGNKKKKILATIIGILAVIAISVYALKIIEEQKEEAAQKYIISISQKLLDGTAIKTNSADKKDYGKLVPLVSIANEDVDKIVSLNKSAEKELNGNMFKNNMNTNELIGSTSAIEKSRKEIGSINNSLAKYETGINENKTNIDKKLAEYKGINTEAEKNLISDYNNLRKKNYDKDMKELNTVKALVASMDKYLAFLQSREGQYVISGGMINFYNQNDVDECNKLVGNITELSKQLKNK
ncbi:hypothetical protein I6U48_20710 [Clostridium sp. PL3]|uniref:Uncharacterized protein n=1 Tax=Clostridium thailandense TaxID=2794346 RepID=A0A949TMX2_9CLOT|nr:hypothetical protein [Clostridium thailandense]MBV7275325.1 hypothetical protein [Clostridium thailandense]